MVEYLIQFLLCPGGAAVASKVVQNKKGSIAHLFKELIIGNFACRREGGAKMVQKIWYKNEKDGLTALDHPIGYGSGQMCLSASTVAA
jgi:hypothetical protein